MSIKDIGKSFTYQGLLAAGKYPTFIVAFFIISLIHVYVWNYLFNKYRRKVSSQGKIFNTSSFRDVMESSLDMCLVLIFVLRIFKLKLFSDI